MHPTGRYSPTCRWTRSSYCLTGSCVEVRGAYNPGVALIRDSKQNGLGGEQPMIRLPDEQFFVFQDELIGKAQPGANGEIELREGDDGSMIFRSMSTGVELNFDAAEWVAFVEGVKAGEFASPAQLTQSPLRHTDELVSQIKLFLGELEAFAGCSSSSIRSRR